MRHILVVVAVGALVTTSESSAVNRGRDQENWTPAQATLLAIDSFGQAAPIPTIAPQAWKRNSDDTCGYLDGDASSAIRCPNAGSCVQNTAMSLVGCCSGFTCNIPHACLPLESSVEGQAADPSSTLWCSQSAAPYCAEVVYLDPLFLGYSGYMCDTSPTTYAVYYSTFGNGGTATTRDLITTKPASQSTDAGQKPSQTPAGARGPSSSPPLGAIIGGAVGGVAVIALAAIGIFVLQPLLQNPNAGPYPPPSSMTEQMPGRYEPYSTLSKGSMGYEDSTISPSVTPAPVSAPTSPPSGFGAAYAVPAFYPDAGDTRSVGYFGSPESLAADPVEAAYLGGQHAAELPAVKGDRELRELA